MSTPAPQPPGPEPSERDDHRGDSQSYTVEGFDASDNSLGDVTAATT